MGILSPSFERLFILSALNFRRQLRGTDLEKPMKAFLGQEAHHDHQIRRFNQALKQLGYDVDKLEQGNLDFCKKLNNMCKPQTQLAFTMGAEHLISLISDQHLKDPIWFNQANQEMAAIWRWHAIEEVEHKSVAYDIYHRVCGGYWRKIWGFLVVTMVIIGMWTRNWWVMAKHDKQIFRPKFWFDTFVFLMIKPAIVTKLLWPMLKYFSPWFHPWQHDNRNLIKNWKAYFSSKPDDKQAIEALTYPKI